MRSSLRLSAFEGGLDWKALSLSPKDMDFAESKAGAAREIAPAFGVPPLLLGLPGDNTFANYAEANRAFWRQTVLPLVLRVQKSFQSWLRPAYGDFRLDYNADRLDALASERAAEWERVGKAPFLTLDEQREAVGYPTSYQSYRRRFHDPVVFRETFGVRIILIHDPRSAKGFRIKTAYPINRDNRARLEP